MDASKGKDLNRMDWEFSYKASDVLKGAQEKLKFSKDRLSFWEKKKNEVKKKIKAEGMNFDESLVNSSFNNSSYRQTGVQIKNDLLKDLEECNSRVNAHRDRIENYQGWIQILKSQGDSNLLLKQDDWLYFFGMPHGYNTKVTAVVKKPTKPVVKATKKPVEVTTKPEKLKVPTTMGKKPASNTEPF